MTMCAPTQYQYVCKTRMQLHHMHIIFQAKNNKVRNSSAVDAIFNSCREAMTCILQIIWLANQVADALKCHMYLLHAAAHHNVFYGCLFLSLKFLSK